MSLSYLKKAGFRRILLQLLGLSGLVWLALLLQRPPAFWGGGNETVSALRQRLEAEKQQLALSKATGLKSPDGQKSHEQLMLELKATASHKVWRRRQMIMEACHNNRGVTQNYVHPRDILEELFWMHEKNHMLFCANHKAGSSTWNYYMMVLASGGQTNFHEYTKSLRERTNGKNARALLKEDFNLALPENFNLESVSDNLLTFTFVRHPFKRVISAYYDKMFGTPPPGKSNFFYLRKRIVNNYRPKSVDPSTPVSPKDFVNYIVTAHKAGVLDIHLRPQYQMCPFCKLDFDYIGTMETFDEDVDYLFNLLQITDKVQAGERHNYSQQSKENEIKREREFFSRLSKNRIKLMYKVYKADFDMFGYGNASEYIEMGFD